MQAPCSVEAASLGSFLSGFVGFLRVFWICGNYTFAAVCKLFFFLYLYLGLFHGWLLRPSHFTLQHVGTYTIKRLSVKKKQTKKHTHTQ